MPWTETSSASFVVRHEAADAGHAEDLLSDLEGFRAELAGSFERVPGDIAVVMHPRSLALALAQPWLPLARLAAEPGSRRYMAGSFWRRELHVLSPDALDARASAVAGSREALLLSPLREYAQLVIGANSPELPPPFTTASLRAHLRWAWLSEGAATHLCGQTPYLRGAIARRLHEPRQPAFPPAARDAPLLGCTVVAMLDREAGREALVRFLSRPLGATGPAAIERAFGRPAGAVERDWRELLGRLRSRAGDDGDLAPERVRNRTS